MERFPPGGSRYQLTKGGNSRNPFWWRDGQVLKLVYGVGGTRFEAVAVRTQPGFEVGPAVPVARGPLLGGSPVARRNFDQVPEGKHIIGVVDPSDAASGDAAPAAIQVVLNWFEEVKQRVP